MGIIKPASLEKLIRHLETLANKPIDAERFEHELETVAGVTFLKRNRDNNQTAPGEAKKKLEKALTRIRRMRGSLNEIGRWEDFRIAHGYRDIPGIAEELKRRQHPIDSCCESSSGEDWDWDPYDEVDLVCDDQRTARACLDRLEQGIQSAINDLKENARRGRREETVSADLISDLADIYERYAGRKAGTSRDAKDGGPFPRFVAIVLEDLEPGRKRWALSQTISDILRDRRRKKSEQKGQKSFGVLDFS